MTVRKKLVELFRAIALNDLEGARKVSESICVIEEKNGHINVAKSLRGALQASGTGFSNQTIDKVIQDVLVTDSDTIGLFKLSQPKKLKQVFLSSKSRSLIYDVLLEFEFKQNLSKHLINPRSKLIFHGHSGCGKSLTAAAIGNEMNLPTYMLRFDEIIGAYLGQTAAKLRQVFRFVEQTPCVLLLDEVDAIGRRRGDARDVGELDRIVISLMQELEHINTDGLIIATTNVPKELDTALWRRFDLAIEFKKPTAIQLKTFAKKVATERRTRMTNTVLNRAIKADSYSACENIIVDEIRRSLITKAKDIRG